MRAEHSGNWMTLKNTVHDITQAYNEKRCWASLTVRETPRKFYPFPTVRNTSEFHLTRHKIFMSVGDFLVVLVPKKERGNSRALCCRQQTKIVDPIKVHGVP